MSTDDDEFLQQLRAAFRVEAAEHLRSISGGLLELERVPGSDGRAAIVETVFRAAHSLKGAARAVNFARVESLCQLLEDVFAAWQRRQSGPTPEALDTLLRSLDAINAILAGTQSDDTGLDSELMSLKQPFMPTRSSMPVVDGGDSDVQARSPPAAVPDIGVQSIPSALPSAQTNLAGETVRVAVAKLEARLLESEEMVSAKLAAAQRVAELQELSERFARWRETWMAAQRDVRRLRRSDRQKSPRSEASAALVRLLDFFESNFDTLKAMEDRTAVLGRTADQDRQALGKLVDDLLSGSKTLLLLPFATMSASFPRLVRDLCRDQGKQAELVIRDEGIEIDKHILEELKDPLVHLLRNSIDHGVEAPAERERLGKPPRANIELSVSQVNGDKVQLLLSDDGAGIDLEKVKAAAVSRGFITASEASQLDEAQAQALIFRSEVSTSPMITQLSGRGLGLAIVREKVEKLGGTVRVDSRPGMGATFRLVIPAVRATFRGILVESAGRVLVVPTVHVVRVLRLNAGDVLTVRGRESIALEGRTLPLVRLDSALELPSVERDNGRAGTSTALIVGSGDQSIAFSVDAVLGEQEVLVKPLRKPLSRVRNIAAVTVLGSGSVAPILNVDDLLKSARKVVLAPPRTAATMQATAAPAKSILVAEDSITSRMLIKNIFESAGYRVKTAVDGAEAFAMLRAEDFDLLVSDVEMPRLNGFDLTSRVRADRKLSEMPVVLVTALETREDRERGIDSGANAYLIKSTFDQSNLLEAVRRLI